MKSMRHLSSLALAGLALLAAPLTLAVAQEIKPVAVVSIASIEEQLADIGYITTVTGMEDAGKTIRLFGSALTAGLDKSRPSGLYVVPAAGDFHAVAFVPVKDLKQFLEIHKEQIGPPEDAGDGVLKMTAAGAGGGGGRDVFIKEQNGWAFVAETKEHLTGLPQDPSTMLGTLPKEYNIAAKVFVQNIPQEMRQSALDELKIGLERGLESPAVGRSDVDKETIQKMARNSLEQIQRLATEGEELVIGLAIDAPGKRTFFEVTGLAKEGTSLATQMALQADAKSAFSGFLLPEASVTLNMTSKLGEPEIAQFTNMVKVFRDEFTKKIDDDPNMPADQREAAKAVFTQFLAHIEKTVASGKIDGGAALVLEPKAINLVAGTYVADGAALEKSLKEIVALGKNEPDAPEVKFNVGQHGDVQLHRLTATIPENLAEAREFFGEKLEMVIGTGPKSFYIAAGKNAENLLKSAIDRSKTTVDKSVPPAQFHVALLPILKFAAATSEGNPMLPALVTSLEQSGNDRISIISAAVPRGTRTRIEVQEGVLKLIGEAMKQFGADLNGVL